MNPDRLRSLYRLFQIHARSFLDLMDRLHSITVDLSGGRQFEVGHLEWLCEVIQEDSTALELASATKQARRIRNQLKAAATSGNQITLQDLSALVAELRRRILEDLEDQVWFRLEAHKTRQFFKPVLRPIDPIAASLMGEISDEAVPILVPKTPVDLFGEKVADNLGSTLQHIEEAARCFICGRHTAVVFNLMRVMEICLRLLGKSLNDPSMDPATNPSWEKILKKCDTELQKFRADRCPEWQLDDTFYSNAVANLRAVKDAWRNPTMHVERDYDVDQASEVWAAVKAFTSHLATKLKE